MAIREQVTIEVDVEGNGLKSLATDARKLKQSLSGVKKESDKASSSFAEQAELAERMRAALGPLGDVLGDVTGGLDDTVTALDGFSTAQVATTAIVLAGVASMFKFAGAIVETITSIDEMAGALRERGDPELNAAVASVEKLNEKLVELGVTYDAQWVLITSRFAPALGGLVEIIDTVLPAYGKLIDANFDLAAALSPTLATLQMIGGALGVVDEMADQSEMVDRLGYSITELDDRFVSLKDEFGQFGQSDELPAFLNMVSDASKDVEEALKASAKQARKTSRAFRSLTKESAKATETATELPSKYMATAVALEDTTVAATVGGEAFNQLAAEANESGDVAQASLQELAQSAESTTAPFLNAVSGTVTAVTDLYNQAMDQRIASMEQGSDAQRKALKQQFAANKAFGIVQATINTALAVMQALGSLPPPASIVLAATAAATGAAQIALIAAQKPPSFHRGGMLPDEQPSFGGSAITRQNEAGVVFTAQGQRSFADAINAMNRGDVHSGAGITVMLDSQPIRGVVTEMGQSDPAYGHRRRQ